MEREFIESNGRDNHGDIGFRILHDVDADIAEAGADDALHHSLGVDKKLPAEHRIAVGFEGDDFAELAFGDV